MLLHSPSNAVIAVLLKSLQDPAGALGAKFVALNTPREKSAPRTTAIMSIAHPYVMRYSIALCAFLDLDIFINLPFQVVCICYIPAPIPENTADIMNFTTRNITIPTITNMGRYLIPLMAEPLDIADIIRLAKPQMTIIAAREKS
jgi:AAA+ ATPase superfamily predicted ATPase